VWGNASGHTTRAHEQANQAGRPGTHPCSCCEYPVGPETCSALAALRDIGKQSGVNNAHGCGPAALTPLSSTLPRELARTSWRSKHARRNFCLRADGRDVQSVRSLDSVERQARRTSSDILRPDLLFSLALRYVESVHKSVLTSKSEPTCTIPNRWLKPGYAPGYAPDSPGTARMRSLACAAG
jgi:hypothetical protein